MRVPIVAVAAAVLVAACAGDGDSGVEPNATAATVAPTPATPQAATSTPASLTALPESEVVYDFYPEPEQPWHKIPSIAVLAATDDRRVGMLTESVAFWNEQLEQIGSPFRLGAISHSVEGVSPDAIARLSARFSDQEAFDEIVRGRREDIVVVMSDVELPFSFATPRRAPDRLRTVIVIRDDSAAPMSHPDVARQVIAHEIGHVIGLGHNNDSARMMCGLPADCELERLQFSPGRFLPLTDGEVEFLKRVYHTGWQPNP